MNDLSLTILPESPKDAQAIERLHERTFGPGRLQPAAGRRTRRGRVRKCLRHDPAGLEHGEGVVRLPLTSPRVRQEVGLPRPCEASSGAIRVRGTLRVLASFEFAEAAPHPTF